MLIKSTLISARIVRKMSTETGPIEARIKKCIEIELKPKHLEIVNESFMHNVPKGSETHFKVLVVSSLFDKLPLIKRHRLINSTIKSELQDEFPHALSIVAKNLDEYGDEYKLEPSPNCRGGFGK